MASSSNPANDNNTDKDGLECVQLQDQLSYQSGFGNTFESEAVKGALPKARNNPRLVPCDLYTEQLSGTAFTCPRSTNRRTWLYRKQPAVVNNVQPFICKGDFFGGSDPAAGILDPNPLRWAPFDDEDKSTTSENDNNNKKTSTDFVTGMHLLAASGDPATKNGLAIYVYLFRESMETSYLYNSDGDFLLVPQEGILDIRTELGRLQVTPGEICVLPRGICFSVHVTGEEASLEKRDIKYRGYVLEIYKGHFILPELGPIGSNGLANARDFQYPVAWCEKEPSTTDLQSPTSSTIPKLSLLNKFGSKIWTKHITSSPYNVVAWHGNYLPYKYDLKKFCAVNSVTYDHLDPSIYTVLTCPGGGDEQPGTALCDFVIFPPRWMSTDENTFRPPWFHRNTMTEFMGLIYGGYDAKTAFRPGGASLHSCMTAHGPDAESYDTAVADPCERPTKFTGGLAFMFETSCMLKISQFALDHDCLEKSYGSCWSTLPNRFDASTSPNFC